MAAKRRRGSPAAAPSRKIKPQRESPNLADRGGAAQAPDPAAVLAVADAFVLGERERLGISPEAAEPHRRHLAKMIGVYVDHCQRQLERMAREAAP